MPDQSADFRRRIDELFPRHVESVLRIALNEAGAPLGHRHVEYLDSWAPPNLEDSIARDLQTAYVLFVAAIFAIDHLWDEQSQSEDDILYPSFVTLAAAKLVQGIQSRAGVTGLIDIFLKSFDEFAVAMKLERAARASRSPDEDMDRRHLVNRSRLFIALFEVICQLKGRPATAAEVRILEEFIFWMQRGDDLGDWREDYRSAQKSYFIRSCAEAMGELPRSEAELEEYVYLSGAYEEEASRIIKGLEEVERRVRDFSAGPANTLAFAAFVEKQHLVARQVLSDFRSIKQQYLVTEPEEDERDR